jgi:membrane associated rhomboid family serine protease
MFIPIGDDNSRRRKTPLIVGTLVAANAFGWYLQLTHGEAFTAALSAVPLELSKGVDLISPTTVTVLGEKIEIPQAPGPHPIYLTALTSMFMHGSWMHLIGNMVYLVIFGDQVEDRLGHLRFLIFYLVCGIAATVAHVSFNPTSVVPCVGASGAIAGVLGAYLVLYPRNGVRVLFFRDIIVVPAFLVLGVWVLMQVLGQFSAPVQEGGVAFMAHIGGCAVGILVGLFLKATGGAPRRAC